jgi:hypothetical protein
MSEETRLGKLKTESIQKIYESNELTSLERKERHGGVHSE